MSKNEENKEEKWVDKKISRRDFLKQAGLVGAGVAIGASGVGAILNKTNEAKKLDEGKNEIQFYGKHQSGISTAVQKQVYFVVLDLHSTEKNEIQKMFQEWTKYSEKLMTGELVEGELENKLLPPKDTGETVGLNPYNLTLTFGISPTFLDKLGMENKKLPEFKELPHFPRDQIKERYSGGDICIQACADDAQVAFHAVRNLIRKGRQLITMKWSQAGFVPIGIGGGAPRNLFGFKDGTANVTDENGFKKVVWYDKDNWLKNGSYLIVRKIQMHLETWDRTNLQEQENTFGRHKVSGRAFSYSNGISEETGQFDAGLLFLCYQKDPQQFIDIQNNLGNVDKLNEYITHIGSGIFACFGGIEKGQYIGQKLFEE